MLEGIRLSVLLTYRNQARCWNPCPGPYIQAQGISLSLKQLPTGISDILKQFSMEHCLKQCSIEISINRTA
jgi:hypothetical protein